MTVMAAMTYVQKPARFFGCSCIPLSPDELGSPRHIFSVCQHPGCRRIAQLRAVMPTLGPMAGKPIATRGHW